MSPFLDTAVNLSAILTRHATQARSRGHTRTTYELPEWIPDSEKTAYNIIFNTTVTALAAQLPKITARYKYVTIDTYTDKGTTPSGYSRVLFEMDV